MGCGAAEATDMGFVCFVVFFPSVLSVNRVDLGFVFCFLDFPIYPPPPSQVSIYSSICAPSCFGHVTHSCAWTVSDNIVVEGPGRAAAVNVFARYVGEGVD